MDELENKKVNELAKLIDWVNSSDLNLEDKANFYETIKEIARGMSLVPCLTLITLVNYSLSKQLKLQGEIK